MKHYYTFKITIPKFQGRFRLRALALFAFTLLGSTSQVYGQAEIDIKGNNTSITDGDATPSTTDNTDFGSVNITGGVMHKTFIIENTGSSSLSLSGTPIVSVSGTNAADFTVVKLPASSIAASGKDTFVVKFDPSAAGTRTAQISIANNDANENPYNFSIQGTGAVIPSDLAVQLGADIDGEASNDGSGGAVSVSADGNRVAIGAHGNNGNGSFSGHVRIYEYNSTTSSWAQLGGDINGEAQFDASGGAISLSSDGIRVAIGANGNGGGGTRSGHVRIYEYNSTTSSWTQLGGDINGLRAHDESGRSVSLNSDGSRVAIGSITYDSGSKTNSGQARIFEYNSTTSSWTQIGGHIDGEQGFSSSGFAVSLNSDGNRVAIGATRNSGNGVHSGHVRIHEYNSATTSWTQLGGDIDGEAQLDRSGSSVSMSSDGSRVAIGAVGNSGNGAGSGHVRLYEYNNATTSWTQLGGDIDGEAAGDTSGYAVSLSSDGSRVAIGAIYNDGNGSKAGHVRIYEYNGATTSWTQLASDIDGEKAGDISGASVSLSSDGSRIVIGAPGNDGNGSSSGHVRVYELQKANPEISVLGNGVEIASGSTTISTSNNTNIGSVDTTGTASVSKTFYIKNTGTSSLSLSGSPIVAISGAQASEFSITTQPSSSIAVGDSSAFVVSFDPGDLGARSASLSMANNDADENPYTFSIQGTGDLPSLLPKRSATDRVMISRTNTAIRDWGRGFEFKPKEPITVTDIGARMIGIDTFPMVLWDVANQKELAKFVFKPTKIGSYEYVELTNHVLLEQGKNYALTAYGDQTGYYFDNSSQANEFIEYVTMRFCGGCSKTQPFPTATLNNYHYGTPDFLFLRSSMLVSGNDNVISPGSSETDTLNNSHFDSVFVNETSEKEYYAFNPVKFFEDTVTVTGSPKVTLSGTNASDFKITQQIAIDTLFGQDSSMFKIEFSPSDTGDREAMVSIAYVDSLNGSRNYTFKITGVGKKPPFSVSFNIDSAISCNGVKDGKITATVEGKRPFTYLWSNSATDSFISNISAGTYTLRIIDANKDTLIDSMSITEPTALAVSAAVDSNVTCFGLLNGGATASATGGTLPHSYAWSNSGVTASLNGVGAGTYSIIVTDKNGCTDSTGATITQPDSIEFNITYTKNISCFGAGDGELGYFITGGTAPYYELPSRDPLAAQDTLTDILSQIYERAYIADGNGCIDSSTIVIIKEPARLTASATIDSNVTCNGFSDGGITAAGSGGTTPYTYLWSNASTTASATGLVAGTYSVTVTDANGCTATSSKTVTEPTLLVAGNITGDDVVCAGVSPNKITELSAASGGTGSITYQWQSSSDNTNWADISGATSSEYQPAGTAGNTWYRRLATDANSCGPVASTAVKITINSAPKVGFTVTAGCKGQQTRFTDTSSVATGNIQSYNWSFGDRGTSSQQNPINVYKNSGSFTVSLKVETDSGCVDSTSQTISVNDMPSVDFSATAECQGTATAFTNKSSIGTGTLGYSWNLGDNNASTVTSPSHTYSNSGYYTVQLTATSNNGCIDSVSKTVQVKQVAKPNFSATSVCEGGTTAFTNLSTNGSSYSWDFGDNGNGSKQANPKNKYKSSGAYTVVLTATSTDGCSDTSQRMVNVYALPVAAFSANEVCLGATTSFTNSSTGASTYQWIFGDGTSSNNAAPSQVYAKSGNYNVELTATTANGCAASAKNTVTVNALPKVAFTTADVCVSDALRTNNTSSGASTYAWTFGDGNTSTATSPSHTYSRNGMYQVQLIATSAKGCVDSSATSINAHAEPQVSFTATDVCFGNNTNFSNTSSIANGTMTYVWNYGNGSTSGNPSPSYGYGSAGTYSIKLVATSNQGCKDSTTGSVDVYAQPTARFAGASVCYGDTFRTSNLSTGTATYAWSFGDGNISTGTAPTNFYGKNGDYEVKLITTTSNNCVDSTSQRISIYAKPIADFEVDDVCDEEKVQFTNTSYDAIIANNTWDFGDGKTDKKANPEHVYGSANSYTATLIAVSNEGCSDTIAQTVTVHPNPVMGFSNTTECDYDATVFTNTSNIASGTINYTWDFGTGDTAQSQSPSYQYAGAGSYKVSLMGVSDKGCSSQIANTITVHPSPLASMLLADNCEEDLSGFESTSRISKGAINTYTWDLGDGNTTNGKKPTHLYAADGVYTIELIVTSNRGCVDTATQSMEVYAKPVADFTVADVCFKATSLFTNTSVDGQDYLYDFGDKWGISTLGSPEYTYEAPGTYSATLYATSAKGCKDTVTKSLTIYSLPVADFTVNNHCFGEAFEPKDESTGNPSNWDWDYADGNTATDANPTHNYGKDGDYNVQLTVTDDNNCIDSFRKTVTVWPLPVVGIRTDTLVSKGYTVPMTATGGVEYKWSPVDNLDRPLTANPTATVVEDVTYTVTVANRFGCTRDTFANLKVREDYTLEPSNIITPDGNGQNDNWVVEKAQYYSDVEVIVFDRWGRIVYTNTAYDNSWNGTSTTGEPLPDGAYYYVVKVPTDREEYKGSITVFR